MQRSDFRIVERLDRFGDTEFVIQHKEQKRDGFLGLFGELKDVWEDFYVEVYKNYVNNQHRFESHLYVQRWKHAAEQEIEFYLEHFSRKPIEYKGEKIIPIIYSASPKKILTYYDPKSYYTRGIGNSGYSLYDEKEFKEKIDRRLDTGKVIKIHN